MYIFLYIHALFCKKSVSLQNKSQGDSYPSVLDNHLKNKKMKDKLIILSGGMDSVTMLYHYQNEIAMALSFNYGANHNAKELQFAALHCQRLAIPHVVIDLQFMATHFKSSLLQGADAIPEADYDADNIKSTVVPFRNGIMLSIAAGVANSHGLSAVMIANHGGDHAIYPDCRPGFISAMHHAVAEGTDQEVSVVAPYTALTKTDIAKIGLRLGVDYSLTWSCYKGLDEPCGVCATCREREQALREAGYYD